MKITSENQILFFKNIEIIRFESVTNNTIIHFINGTSSEIHEPIDSIEKQLTDVDFIRIHDEHIINVNYLTKIPDNLSHSVELENGVMLPVNKKTKNLIINILKAHIKN